MSRSAEELDREWAALVEQHLPVRYDRSIWRANAPDAPAGRVGQGWKLHITTTLPGATDTLRRCARVLGDEGVRWKAPGKLADVRNLNTGLFHGYSQIGKIITAYPGDDDTARGLAARLDAELAGSAGPAVPFDRPYRRGGVVFYRYGVIDPVVHTEVDGKPVPALTTPDGELVPDVRAAGHAVPEWVTDTLSTAQRRGRSRELPFVVYEAISQRGKGGVYKALDLAADPPRRCVVKEGRRHGETEWDGRDGRRRVAHEHRVLRDLAARRVAVPEVFAAFVRGGHQYLVVEHLDGVPLSEAEPDDPVATAARIAGEVAAMHAAGWAWRDCKAQNIMLTPHGPVLLDVEGACRPSRPDPQPWGSPGHLPPEWPDPRFAVAQDLYALGVVLSKLVDDEIVVRLLDPDPCKRPDATSVHSVLSAG